MRQLDLRVTLKKNYEFRRLYAKGKSAVTPYFVIYCRKNSGRENRVGYTVSVKLGKAVTRNRIRRRLRETYRLNADRLAHGFDLVIVARSRSAEADFYKLEQAFIRACRELGMLKDGRDE